MKIYDEDLQVEIDADALGDPDDAYDAYVDLLLEDSDDVF